MSDIETIIIKRDVDVELSEVEKAALRESACAALDTVDELADRIKTLKAGAKEARAKAKRGTETRMLECREEKDFRLGEVRVVRSDTGQIVETRAMTGDERQVKINGAAPVVPITGRTKKLGSKAKGAPDPDDKRDEGEERKH
jgi:hypothetical protein